MDDRAAVIDAMQQWEIAVETGDFEKLEHFYEENAIYYPDHAEPVIGRDRIMEKHRSRGVGAVVDINQQPDDVTVSGTWAAYSGEATVSVAKTNENTAAVRHVRVLLLMQKGEDGHWRILRDIDNEPPGGMAAQ
ncbi:MAG TPA: DUF4440 domain-containing protein [Xanthomonadales bacterium]|nr:DUF4440 domain-containing protein [Xanthomonadales bacterium]